MDLTVRVGTKPLVDRIFLSVSAGESVALVGPNGAGKSTLLRALSGEVRPSSGDVILKGRSLYAWKPRSLALQRAVVSQNVNVAFPFLVREIVRMGAGERAGRVIDALVDAALEEVGLRVFHDRIISTLSGGEQQRVHFARALVQLACGEVKHGPGVLLLDEPTASLDLYHQLDILAAIRTRVRNGTTVVTIVHDLNLATVLAHRIIVLVDGKIAAAGSPIETINDKTLRDVFGVASVVGQTPNKQPFVLPHSARKVDPTPM